nr:hypothetical protein [Tanacetum cinerariifolium]
MIYLVYFDQPRPLKKVVLNHATVLSFSCVAPYSDATLEVLKTKHPFKPALSLPHIPFDHHYLIAAPTMVLDRIKSFPRSTSCGRDGLLVNLFLDGSCPKMLGEYIASAPLTLLVKPGGGIRPIVVGIILRRLVSKVSDIMIGHSLDGYLDDLQFGVMVSRGSEENLHVVNCLIKGRGDDVGLSMLLVDFKDAFNLVDREVMLREVHLCFPAISLWVEFHYSNPARLYYRDHTLWSCQGVQQGDPLGLLLFALVSLPLICKIRDSFTLSLQAWYLDDGTIVGDTLVVGNVLESIMEDGPQYSLHLNINKTKVFWPNEDTRSKLTSVFPSNIARPSHGVKLLCGPASMDFDFCSQLVMKRVAKTIMLMDVVAKINDPQCIPLFFVAKPCSVCSRVFARDIYGNHVVLCAGIIGIKHHYNVVRDTLLDICYRSGISAGKEVDIGLDGGRDKPLRLADMLLYSWDGGLDVCVDLTGSLPLTQTGMVDFVPGLAVIDAAQCKRDKYIDKCVDIRYGFLSFSFSSLGELEVDTVTLLKRIRKFSMTQDIGA